MFMDENQISASNTTPLVPLTIHRKSQTLSKTRPKIRIIHIFAAEIIKTDAANFRELVQRLTGKPNHVVEKIQKKGPRISSRDIFSSNKKMKVIKGEEEDQIWKGANINSEGGFLGGFAEFDGLFMQEINHFPILEGTTTTNQMDALVESQLIAN